MSKPGIGTNQKIKRRQPVLIYSQYETIQNILEQELWDTIEQMEEIKKITQDEANDLWHDKAEGMRWLNQ